MAAMPLFPIFRTVNPPDDPRNANSSDALSMPHASSAVTPVRQPIVLSSDSETPDLRADGNSDTSAANVVRRRKLVMRSSRKRYTYAEDAAIKRILREHVYLSASGRPTFSWNRRGFATDKMAPTVAEFWQNYEFKAPFSKRSAASLGRHCAVLIRQLSGKGSRRSATKPKTAETPASTEDCADDDKWTEEIVRSTWKTALEVSNRLRQSRNANVTFSTDALAIASNMLISLLQGKWSSKVAALARHAHKDTIDNEDVMALFCLNPSLQDRLRTLSAAVDGDSSTEAPQLAPFTGDRDEVSMHGDLSTPFVATAHAADEDCTGNELPANSGTERYAEDHRSPYGAEDDFYDAAIDLAADAACATLTGLLPNLSTSAVRFTD